ncbi:hypothetical protein BDW71DRAFT_214829 [Aspergillus fruticulosus]
MFNTYVAITPRLKNIAYNSKEALADHLPADPVLSILQFTYRPGVNVAEPSQRAHILWQKSLKLVSTVPGFQRMFWAPVDHTSPHQQIIVLIQWDSGHGWKRFQSSLGFSMMLGYIESISNRCIQSVLPVNLPISDSLLELVSFRFGFSDEDEYNQKPGFKSKWETVFAPFLSNTSANAESDLLYCCGEWLEADQASEDRYFVGMLFWKPDSQDGHRHRRQANDHNLRIRIAHLVEDTAEVVSVYTRQLSQVHVSSGASIETLGLSTLSPSPVSVNGQFNTNHPVFQSHVKREYNLDEQTFSQGQDQCHLESMRQARQTPPQRIAGGPAGTWYPMGKISQHHLPQSLEYSGKPTMDWISFRAQRGHPAVGAGGAFEDLRRKLWGMGDCPRIFWGKCQENKGEGEGNLISFSLFIALEHSEHSKHQKPEAEAEAEVRAQLQQYIHEFKDACGDAIQDLSHRRTPGLFPFPSVPHSMDMVIFDISPNETDQRSFGYAFSNYQATTRQTQVVGNLHSPWSAFMPRCQGWLSDYDYKSPPQQSEQEQPLPVQFISIFECEKEGAREEWYHDFAERAQTQYDLLGHIVDWLRTLSTRITIQHLVVEKEDPWMTADRLAKAQRPPPPLPPSIFDLPRARQANK